MECAAEQKTNTDAYWIGKNRYYYNRITAFYRFVISENSRVLQVGCRSGYILNAVKPSYGIGIDKNATFISEASSRYSHLKFLVGDIGSLARDEKFDYIILSHTLMREYDIQIFLEKLKWVCDKETRIVINICSDLWEPLLKFGQFIGLRRDESFLNWLQLSDLENFLHISGFEVVSKDYRTLIPKYIPLFSTLLNSIVANIPIIRKLCLDQFIVARLVPEVLEASNMSASIVVPCKNERGNIEAVVKRTPKLGEHTEIIFVEGGSTDGTLEEINRVMKLYGNKEGISIRCLVQDGKGKGDAVRKGFKNASGDVLMILDTDLTVAPEELFKFWDALISGKGEFINGVRLIYAMESSAMRFLNLIANKLFSTGFSWMFNQRIRDTLCGTKVLFKKDWKKIESGRAFWGDFDPFGDFDLIFGAVKNNLKLLDMPIHYKERTYGVTQISRFRHGLMLLGMSWFAFKKFRMW